MLTAANQPSRAASADICAIDPPRQPPAQVAVYRVHIGTYPNSFLSSTGGLLQQLNETLSVMASDLLRGERVGHNRSQAMSTNGAVSGAGALWFDWIKKFAVNRVLYSVLLMVLCLGIFPFCTLYPFTMWIGRTWDSMSSNKTHAQNIEHVWDVIGRPYDYLVKLVG